MLAALAFASTLMVSQPIPAQPPPVRFDLPVPVGMAEPDGVEAIPGPFRVESWPAADAVREIHILDEVQGVLLLEAPPCGTTAAKGWGICVEWTIDPKAPYVPAPRDEPPQ